MARRCDGPMGRCRSSPSRVFFNPTSKIENPKSPKKIPLHPVCQRVTVAPSDTLDRHRDRKAAMAEINENDARPQVGGSREGRLLCRRHRKDRDECGTGGEVKLRVPPLLRTGAAFRKLISRTVSISGIGTRSRQNLKRCFRLASLTCMVNKAG
jgi:hypothetical protein